MKVQPILVLDAEPLGPNDLGLSEDSVVITNAAGTRVAVCSPDEFAVLYEPLPE